MDLRVVVGLNVQRIRRGQTLSQEELSFRSGFTRSYLSGLEAGRRNATILSLAKIASALGASVEDLIRQPAKETVVHNKPASTQVTEKRKSGS